MIPKKHIAFNSSILSIGVKNAWNSPCLGSRLLWVEYVVLVCFILTLHSKNLQMLTETGLNNVLLRGVDKSRTRTSPYLRTYSTQTLTANIYCSVVSWTIFAIAAIWEILKSPRLAGKPYSTVILLPSRESFYHTYIKFYSLFQPLGTTF